MSIKPTDENDEKKIDQENASFDKAEPISDNNAAHGNPINFPGTDIYENNSLKTYNSRTYPHWELQNVVYHACFRLADSVPIDRQREWLAERKQIQDICKKEQRTLREDEMKRLRHLYSDKIEHFLDVGYGSCVLQMPKVAEIVRGSLEYYNKIKYLLHAWCIMPNHVHVIFQTLAEHSHSEIIQGWKSYTAHAINKYLGLHGSLWQGDCYNHIIRSSNEYYQQIRYVWNNPLKAGHAKWEWRWKCLED
ncbi:MAG: transposase [Victivallales bacterium]|nr:transposase [Victivallales bacterium]